MNKWVFAWILLSPVLGFAKSVFVNGDGVDTNLLNVPGVVQETEGTKNTVCTGSVDGEPVTLVYAEKFYMSGNTGVGTGTLDHYIYYGPTANGSIEGLILKSHSDVPGKESNAVSVGTGSEFKILFEENRSNADIEVYRLDEVGLGPIVTIIKGLSCTMDSKLACTVASVAVENADETDKRHYGSEIDGIGFYKASCQFSLPSVGY